MAASHDDGEERSSIASDSASASASAVLPVLGPQPVVYAGCCLALSAPLVDHVASLLADAPLVLSIGSGQGLLEALLRDPPYSLSIVGVEVGPSPNKYLPAEAHRALHGSRFLEPLARAASAWLFIYPRRPGLLNEYMAQFGSQSVQQILWVGPQADWAEYANCFDGWSVRTYGADAVGGRAWELIAVAAKRCITCAG